MCTCGPVHGNPHLAPISPLTPTLSSRQLSQRMCGRKESVEDTSERDEPAFDKGRFRKKVGQVSEGGVVVQMWT